MQQNWRTEERAIFKVADCRARIHISVYDIALWYLLSARFRRSSTKRLTSVVPSLSGTYRPVHVAYLEAETAETEYHLHRPDAVVPEDRKRKWRTACRLRGNGCTCARIDHMQNPDMHHSVMEHATQGPMISGGSGMTRNGGIGGRINLKCMAPKQLES